MAFPSRSAGDEKILSYRDAALIRSDLTVLSNPSSFINDRIIHFYFTHLSLSLSPSSVLLLPPSLSFLLSNLPPGSEEALISPLDLPEKTLILFPVNDNPDASIAEGGTHWSLLAYYRPAGLFVHHDSNGGMNSPVARRLYRAVRAWVGGGGGRLASLVEGPTPQQGNGYDCGVYVMAIAAAICHWWKEKEEEEEEEEEDRVESEMWYGVVREKVEEEKVGRLRREILELVMRLMAESK